MNIISKENEVKFRPMLFSTPMVKALLNGSKTQTRRIVKSRHESGLFQVVKNREGTILSIESLDWDERNCEKYILPIANVGDIIWVKETVKRIKYGAYWDNDSITTPDYECKYIADDSSIYYHWLMEKSAFNSKKVVPSIFMRKYESRIWLKVMDVRVERLNDISESDAIGEGVVEFTKDGTVMKYGLEGWDWSDMPRTAIEGYKRLWESINGVGSWELNPWVFVYDFEVLEGTPEGFLKE